MSEDPILQPSGSRLVGLNKRFTDEEADALAETIRQLEAADPKEKRKIMELPSDDSPALGSSGEAPDWDDDDDDEIDDDYDDDDDWLDDDEDDDDGDEDK